jgi:hypothetical protein
MWRVKLPGAPLTDMVNHTRARDAAATLALATLNAAEAKLAIKPAAHCAAAHPLALAPPGPAR